MSVLPVVAKSFQVQHFLPLLQVDWWASNYPTAKWYQKLILTNVLWYLNHLQGMMRKSGAS